MRNLAFFVTLVGCILFPAQASKFLMRQALEEDRQCMVEYVYSTAGYATVEPSILDAAAQACINYDRGVGQWYAQEKIKENPDFDVTDEKSQDSLKLFKKQAVMVLRHRLAQCQFSLTAEDCLEKMGIR